MVVRLSNGGLNKEPFDERTVFNHSNTELVRYSDPHCIQVMAWITILCQFLYLMFPLFERTVFKSPLYSDLCAIRVIRPRYLDLPCTAYVTYMLSRNLVVQIEKKKLVVVWSKFYFCPKIWVETGQSIFLKNKNKHSLIIRSKWNVTTPIHPGVWLLKVISF